MLRKLPLILTLIWWSFSYYDGVVGDPQNGSLLKRCCSVFTVSNSNERSFFENINDTFIQLRRQIRNESKHFGTAEKGSDNVPVYSMFKCRDYLSIDDCLACFTTATTQIRDCSAFNGARVIYDGCFLRYESGRFYDETYDDYGNGSECNGTNTNEETIFGETVQQALREVQRETPRFKGISIATKTPIASGGAVYAAAECVETTTKDACLRCMEVVHNNLIRRLPNTGCSAYIAGCYMRYSDRPFFAENQTVDPGHYSKQGNSSSKWAIIGCVVGGAVVFILAILCAWLNLRVRLSLL